MSKQFKAGDKVKCIDASMCAAPYLTEGQVYTVSEDLPTNGWMRLEGVEHPYTAWNYGRFELVKDEPKFKAGDKVKCIDAVGREEFGLHTGKVYEVAKLEVIGGDPRVYLTGQEPGTCHKLERFELVTEPANACAVRYINGIFSGTLEQYPSVEEARKAIAEQGYHGLTYEFFEMVPAGKMTITQTVTRELIES